MTADSPVAGAIIDGSQPRFEAGRIVEHFSYPDLLGLFRQLDA